MEVLIKKDLSTRFGILKGTIHDWPRMAIKAYERQFGPFETWGQYVQTDTTPASVPPEVPEEVKLGDEKPQPTRKTQQKRGRGRPRNEKKEEVNA